MKRHFSMVMTISFVLTILISYAPHPSHANSDILLGITWGDSLLVSFDPYTGTITEVHAQLNPNESFRGLSYDSNHNMLYALSQVDLNLYSIDPITLEVQHIGNLHTPCHSRDIGGLTYDSSSGNFYTTLYDGNSTELLTVNVNNAKVSSLGTITNGYCFSPSYHEDDGNIYGFSLYGSGSWYSPYKSSVVSINPDDATMTTLFETPCHAILGLAKKPNENIFYTWVSWTSHFYGVVNLDSESITLFGNSDPVGVSSDAMIYKNFYVGSGTLLPIEEHPILFNFVGHVTEISDPYNLLDDDVAIGDEFSGQFIYDINRIYLYTSEQSPYGISVEIGSRNFSFSGLWAGVRNNYYDCDNETTYDSFYLDSKSWDDSYEYISITLTDYSSTLLSNNIFLPNNFDVTSWDEKKFYIYSGDCYSEPQFKIQGEIDEIIPDSDSDGDGTSNYFDNCPNDPDKTETGICGCGVPDVDTDSDGTLDCIDGCDQDPYKKNPGVCGCGVPDTDNDGDRMIDCWEQNYGLDPSADDANNDLDGDGYTNLVEYQRGTDPSDPNSYPPKAMPWIPLLLLGE